MTEATDFELSGAQETTLRGSREGSGPAIVLAHGITAHRGLVVHGSSHLARSGYELVAYDARAHGMSDPGEEGSYDYETLADDLDAVASEHSEHGRPLLVGHSMGAHTITTLALRDPSRWAGLVIIGPVSRGEAPPAEALSDWDAMADGLAGGGVEGWLEAYEAQGLNPDWRETLLRIARDRISRHQHPEALAQALREVPRAVPFAGIAALAELDLPCLVVGSHDEADPGHPYETAELYAEQIPGARLISEERGDSPLAWQGGKLSREIEAFAGEDPVAERR